MESSSLPSRTKENAPGCASGGTSTRLQWQFSHFFPARAKDFSREGLEEAAAPNADEQRGAKKRSEEHTSELQSRLHLVCRLLLEKKKKNEYIMQCYALSSTIDELDVA